MSLSSYAVTPFLLGLALLFQQTATAADRPHDDRPNILWLTSEDDNVNWVGCYGNPYAQTPHIDALAAEGFRYTQCYANAPVCAPSRSTWITGVHALSMGTHPMRSRYPIPHETIKYYPDLLKQAGYFVGNVTKTDYNIGGRADQEAWDTNRIDWKQLKKHQPFFLVVNNNQSHESKAFGDINQTTHRPENVRLAPYHPDLPVIRKNYALYHDQVKKMDADIGRILARLESEGLADNTIVIHNSDHGGVLPRSKRFLYDSGTHCPLIIRIPKKFSHLRPGPPGTQVDDLVSFIDMTKTWLDICGAEKPAYLQGKTFLGPHREKRSYHVSYRTRMDERIDNVRAIRDRKYLYIRNYMPYVPQGQHLTYLWKMPAMQAWEQANREGKTDTITGRFFKARPPEEFYDTENDPDNIHNLIDDPRVADDIKRLRTALDRWQLQHFDTGLLPETEIVRRSQRSGQTIYEMARDPALYNLPRLQMAASRALQQDPQNLERFYHDLADPDAGIRYWAVVGCFLLQPSKPIDLELLRKRLDDPSHHVRIMAAWSLYRGGDKQAARSCWNQLLRETSYASLMVLNVIDWSGDAIEPYTEAIEACGTSADQNAPSQRYINRMKDYFKTNPPRSP